MEIQKILNQIYIRTWSPKTSEWTYIYEPLY